MDNFNSYKDLKEHFSNFKLMIEDHAAIDQSRQALGNIVDKLIHEIEALKKSEHLLTQQLHNVTSASETEAGINTLYVNLKEKYNDLRNKCNELQKENALIQEKHTTEEAALAERYKYEKNKIFEDLDRQINEQRNEFIRKEQQLFNELQLAQASNALQSDEMESIQMQLRNSNQSCNALNEQYLTLQIHSNYDVDAGNKRIHELERKLQLTEQQLLITQEQLFNVTKNKGLERRSNKDESTVLNQNQTRPVHSTALNANKSTAVYDKKITFDAKYESLNINAVNSATNINQSDYGYENLQKEYHENLSAQKKLSHRPEYGNGNSKKVASSNIKSFLPALKQLSKSAQKPSYSRKRKLHNPGSMDYLIEAGAELD